MTSKHGDKAGTSDWFKVTNSVKQEFVLVPTLFSLFMSAMLKEVFNGKEILGSKSRNIWSIAY